MFFLVFVNLDLGCRPILLKRKKAPQCFLSVSKGIDMNNIRVFYSFKKIISIIL